MKDKLLKNILADISIQEEVFEHHVFNLFSKKEIAAFSSTSTKNRATIIKNLFKNPENYGPIISQYFSFWLMNLYFITPNKTLYQAEIINYCNAESTEPFEKIKAYTLLKALYQEDTVYQTYYSRLLSLLETGLHPLTLSALKEATVVQQASDLAAPLRSAEKLKISLLNNSVPLKEKVFLTNIFKYWDSPSASKIFMELKTYALNNIKHIDLRFQEEAVTLLGAISSIWGFNTIKKSIHLLSEKALLSPEPWLRKTAFHALRVLIQGVRNFKLNPAIETVIGNKLKAKNSMYQNEYAIKFLASSNIQLSTIPVSDFIDLLINEAERDDEFCYEVKKASLKAIIPFLVSMSDEQRLAVVRVFYHLLSGVGTFDKLLNLVHQGLAHLSKACSDEKIKSLIEGFSEKDAFNTSCHGVSSLQVLSYFTQHLSNDKFKVYLENLLNYLTEDNRYIQDKAYQALDRLISQLSDTQVSLAVSILLKKVPDANFAIRLEVLESLAYRVTDESAKNISMILSDAINSEDFDVCEWAIQLLKALIAHKKMIPSDGLITQLLQKIQSKEIGVYSASVQALVQCVFLIHRETIEKTLLPALLCDLQNPNHEIQVIAMDGLSKLSNYVTRETFTTQIQPILLSQLQKEPKKLYRETFFSIQGFKLHILLDKPEILISLLIEQVTDQNYEKFLQYLLTTLSNFSTHISTAQQAVLKDATTFKTEKTQLSPKDKEKSTWVEQFWTALYTAKFQIETQTEAPELSSLPPADPSITPYTPVFARDGNRETNINEQNQLKNGKAPENKNCTL